MGVTMVAEDEKHLYLVPVASLHYLYRSRCRMLLLSLMDCSNAKYLLIDLFVLCKSNYGWLVVHKEI